MGRTNIKLEIAKAAEKIKPEDMTGTLTLEAALKQAKRNFNRVQGLHQIIKAVIGETDN